jgi:hypothetical protein
MFTRSARTLAYYITKDVIRATTIKTTTTRVLDLGKAIGSRL